MKNSSPSRMEFRIAVGTSLLILSTILLGCASSMEKGLLPELAIRQPTHVELGQELILLDKSPLMSSSLIDNNGVVHVFAVNKVNKAKQLNHIEIIDNKITKREVLGIIETKQGKSMDALEHPPGTIRVLAGDKQYFQITPDQGWQEIKGNRCARFVPVGDDLYCAFVIKGEEVGGPERTDYTFGWFLLVPIFYWSHEYASKLVLAQESPDGWVVRAVVDPDTPLDTHNDFMVGTDSMGNIHFLYYTSKGGGGFFVVAAGLSGAAGSVSPEAKLRYAKLTFNELLAYSKDIHNKASSNNLTRLPWKTVKGSPLTDKPFIKHYHSRSRILLRPLNRHFSLNEATGEINGLMFVTGATLDDGKRQLPFYELDSSWVEVSLSDGQWSPNFNVVTATDFPTSTRWLADENLILKADSEGNIHVLLESQEVANIWFGPNPFHTNYLVKARDKWSVPLVLGSQHYRITRSLAVDSAGNAFVAWVNKKGKFVGKWIKPITKNSQKD